MRNELYMIEQIERFLNNELNTEEKESFTKEMALDKNLHENVMAQEALQRAITKLGLQEEIIKAGKSYRKAIKIKIAVGIIAGLGLAGVAGFAIFKLLQQDVAASPEIKFDNSTQKTSIQGTNKILNSEIIDSTNHVVAPKSTIHITAENKENSKLTVVSKLSTISSDTLSNNAITENIEQKNSLNVVDNPNIKIAKSETVSLHNAKYIPQKPNRKGETKFDDWIESIGGVFYNWGSFFKSKQKNDKNKIETATITIANKLKEDINIFWVNDKNTEIYYKSLRPNAGYVQETYLGHLWRIKTNNKLDKVIEFRITKRNQHFDNQGVVSQEKYKKTQKDIFWEPVFKEAITASTITVKNALKEAVAVYWLDYRNDEIQYFKLAPDEEIQQQTFLDQNWRIRKQSDSTLVLQFTVKKLEEYFEVK